ncbi:MAG: tRNA pseudouridine(13) synthase TruD [Spongiibacteraceae bacterium]
MNESSVTSSINSSASDSTSFQTTSADPAIIHYMPEPYAYGEPAVTGVLRQSAEDFYVEEILGFEPEGEGEHVFIWVEKIGLNTQQVADSLARLAKVPARQVSYSGMKDRNAVTRQWFGVHLPGNHSYDWESLNSDQLKILQVARHLRKLRRGVHKANRFVIKLSELALAAGELEIEADIQRRLALITAQGVPNYFGEQRFGHGGANLTKAQQLFSGSFKVKRHQRGIYLSAARSHLFNQLLAARVTANNWNSLLAGELLMLNGTHSVFAQRDEENLAARLADGDIHLSGPLYGKATALCCEAEVAELEQQILAAFPEFLVGLKKEGLKAERRALRVIPQDMQCTFSGDSVELAFSLPSGCFATSVVRELVHYRLSRG